MISDTGEWEENILGFGMDVCMEDAMHISQTCLCMCMCMCMCICMRVHISG